MIKLIARLRPASTFQFLIIFQQNVLFCGQATFQHEFKARWSFEQFWTGNILVN